MFTRNASECRAKEPRTCYYHGAIITMNEATERFRATGDPEALDVYYKSRQRVEAAEEELRKQQWLREADAVPSGITATSTPTAPQTTGSTSAGSNRARPNTNNGRPTTQRGKAAGTQKRTRGSAPRQSAKKPFVPATKAYNESIFPQQVVLPNEKNQQVTFTRHDKAAKAPSGVMLAASRALSREEQQHLAGLLRYQHTAATREKGKAKITPDEDIIVGHSSRSVYIKSQFDADGKQLPTFHDGLNKLMKEGSPRRQDGTQKYPPFTSDVEMAVYYTD